MRCVSERTLLQRLPVLNYSPNQTRNPGRLLVVAGGNVRDAYDTDHLSVSDTSPIEDPGSIVERSDSRSVYESHRYTDRTPISPVTQPWRLQESYLRSAGRPSSFRGAGHSSQTSSWEGGNLLVSPDATHFDEHHVVSITTTSDQEPLGRPLTTANATSAATAQAARLAARIEAIYPDFWPETIRGLLVHGRGVDAAHGQRGR